MITKKEIERLHATQKAKLSSMRSITAATSKRKQSFAKSQRTADEHKAHAATNADERDKAESVLHDMRGITGKLEGSRGFWTKDGYMMRARTVPPATDSETLIGKAMTDILTNLLDETIRVRIGNEATRMTPVQLERQADDALATDDYQTIRLLRLEAQTRSDSKSREALKHINGLVESLQIPEQTETLALIDESIAWLNEARQLWFSLQGGGYLNTDSIHQKSYGGQVMKK